MRKAKWQLTLPLTEARKNEEIVSLADSQVLRWLDELNGVTDADAQARSISQQIRRLRKEPSSLQNRRQIRKLYEQLDTIQFKPDYLCVIMDREKDYLRAVRGFTINGIKYHRLLGTNGGVKNETIVFISDRHGDEIRKRIDNGRDMKKELVPAKLEAYKALTCSASTPVSMPNGILVVNDCETQFVSDIIYLNDEQDGEPVMEDRPGVVVDLDESDGYGLMLPSLAARWGEEIGINYIPSGMNTRFSWEKGMVFCFDFLEFAEKVAENYTVKDAWGAERDIRDVELILTTSMLKLWDSYESCEDYIRNCLDNKYTFGIAKVCPEELESEHNLNYQFIQSYNLSDVDIGELIAPTLDEISEILHADLQKTILFLKGASLTEENIERQPNDFCKALMIEPDMIDDPFIQDRIYQFIKGRINEAKVGVIKVHGNYSIVSGDPYSLCQSIFGLEVTGLLRANEVYNGYWVDGGTKQLACFRAPMTCHNNIRLVNVNDSDDAKHWYRYMNTCTLFNSWDTAAHALNGMDKDGDLVMLTDNQVLLKNLRPLPALMCIQRKAEKKVVTEEDAVRANINSFGDDIGKITNRITSMFEVQSKYLPESKEYKILDYRIKCGQLYQQNSIDKAKGIISKPMPKEWYDRHYAAQISDPEYRQICLDILADKKPYFMRYIYPNLMQQYNSYIKNTNKKSMREFATPIAALLSREPSELSEKEAEFLEYYHSCMPVGMGDCVINKICRRFEESFDGYIGRHNASTKFDYTIMKSGCEYSKAQYYSVKRLLDEYNNRIRDYAAFVTRERVDDDEAATGHYFLMQEFRMACDAACSNGQVLCDIVLDICYQKSSMRHFAWFICGDEIIANLLARNENKIQFPVLDVDGDIKFCGRNYSTRVKEIGVNK